jgi:D-alanyl-D-alanine carboxypeptidase
MSIIRTSVIALSLAAAVATTQSAPAQAEQAPKHRAVQKALDQLVEKDGFPGVIASVRDRKGRVRTYTAGVGNLTTGAPVPKDGRVRIASNTKMFTATRILQLVGEGRISLDAHVERYLPGVVRGHGNDGRRITVRMLLQQTSGLPDFDTIVLDAGGTLADVAHTYFDPRQLVDAALDGKRAFKPGKRWEYSNTNYVLLGLIAERVAGRPIGEQITSTIIKPLRLKDTYWPRQGEQRIRGSHPQGYFAAAPGDPWQNLTTLDPSLGWAAGQLVSTPRDLNRFMNALLDGRLLKPAQLAQMRKTVDAPGFEPTAGWRYGLGLARHRTDCGVVGWGHGGDIQGFESRNLATDDGRSATVVVTGLPTTLEMIEHVSDAVDTALCAS